MNPWIKVREFESAIADFFGAPYAVSTDSCTHAIELSLRLKNPDYVTCPEHTYISVPFTFLKLGVDWRFVSLKWKDFYQIGDSNIYDAAVLWRENSYIPGTLMCVSFQYQKHLSLGRGGVILLDNKSDHQVLKMMRYDGRTSDMVSWTEQDFVTLGYHYYMTPETAERGLTKLQEIKNSPPRIWTDADYPYLPDMSIFKNVK